MLRFFLKGLFVISLLGFAFLLGLILMDRVVMPKVVGRGNVVIVPDVTESTIEDAESVLKELGLVLVKESEVYDPVVPEGFVISQRPRAYSKVKSGRRIRVVVSKGSEKLTVPDLTTGISLRQAEIVLKSSGFELGYVSYQFSEEFQKGVVISQSPPPNGTAPRGALVNVTVSSGLMTGVTVVPELIGLSLESAIVELKEVGLAVGTIDYVEREDLLPETVIEQSLGSGTEVERGKAVDLTVTR